MTKSLARFFDSELIARLSRMELTAQRIVDGFLAGRNRSSRHGFSVEFVEHREYAPGDDLRHLDWKVLGRLDRYYIKRYEEETNITAVLLVDCSRSMTYASNGVTKFETAATAAAALGHLLHRQRDAVGLVLFDEGIRERLPPSVKSTSLAQVAAKLEGAELRGKSSFDGMIRDVCGQLPGRCLFVIASDLFMSADDVEAGLRFLRYHGHDAVVLQVLDPAEREFPFRTNMLFRGLEDDRRLLAEPQRLRKQYLTALDEFLGSVRKSCEKAAFDYQLLTGRESLTPALTTLVAARNRRRRVSGNRAGS